jgi:hypothetical protein
MIPVGVVPRPTNESRQTYDKYAEISPIIWFKTVALAAD